MKQATLCILTKGNEILLAMKKRGFGAGKWNGVGGKVNHGESVLKAAEREIKEEIGVSVYNLQSMGILHFEFPYKPEWNQDVHLFLAREWDGEPEESEEMAPKWFGLKEIPYDKMWDDDKFWLPRVLNGEKIEANFFFKEGEIIDKHDIRQWI